MPQARIDVIQPERAKDMGLEEETAVQRFVATSAIVVVDVPTCQQAVALRTEIKTRQQKVAEFFAPMKDAAHKLHKAICQRESAVLAPLDALDGTLRRSIQTWNDEQAAIARKREAELAEQRRIDEEARAIAEAAALEEAARHAPTREVADEMFAQADAVVEQAIAAPAPVVVVESAAKQVAGLKTRRDWRWRFVGGPAATKDILKETPALVVARAMTKLPREYCMPDVRKISAIVDAMHDTTAIPGVEVYSVDVPVR